MDMLSFPCYCSVLLLNLDRPNPRTSGGLNECANQDEDNAKAMSFGFLSEKHIERTHPESMII